MRRGERKREGEGERREERRRKEKREKAIPESHQPDLLFRGLS